MSISPEVGAAIEAARHEAHLVVDKSFDSLYQRLNIDSSAPTGTKFYTIPTDADCRDSQNKNGRNLTARGLELLFRLLDDGAGYNSAARKFSITQSAVKNRKKDWFERGGKNRKKMFIVNFDSIV